MIRHLAGLAEIVEDVDEALSFYCEVLGLPLKDRMGADYAVLELPGVLHFAVWNRGAAAESVYGDRGQADRIPLGLSFEFEVDSVPEAAAGVAANGLNPTQGPREEPWGQKTTRLFSPTGSLLGLVETPWARTLP